MIKPANESAIRTLKGLKLIADKMKPTKLRGSVKISKIKYSFKSVKKIMSNEDTKIEKNNAFRVRSNFK